MYLVQHTLGTGPREDLLNVPEIVDFFKELEATKPAGVIIISTCEVEVLYIFGPVLDKLTEWTKTNNKKVYMLSPCQQYTDEFPNDRHPNVIWREYHGFDLTLSKMATQLTEAMDRADSYLIPGNGLDDRHGKAVYGLRDMSPTRLFTCYNNRQSEHRHKLIDQLAKHDLLKLGMVTYRHYVMAPHMSIEPPLIYFKGETSLMDEEDFVLHDRTAYSPFAFPRSYFTGTIDIVTESRYLPNEFYMSEKANKPIVACKPFLVLGCQGFNQWLRDTRDIELYDELFDYSFDNEPLLEDRINGIVQNLIRLQNEDPVEILRTVQAKCDRNLVAFQASVVKGNNIYVHRFSDVDGTPSLNEEGLGEVEHYRTWLRTVYRPHYSGLAK